MFMHLLEERMVKSIDLKHPNIIPSPSQIPTICNVQREEQPQTLARSN